MHEVVTEEVAIHGVHTGLGGHKWLLGIFDSIREHTLAACMLNRDPKASLCAATAA